MTILTDSDVQEIIKILDGSAYDSFRVTTSAFSLSVKRTDSGWAQERTTLSQPHVLGNAEQVIVAAASAVIADEDVPGLISVRAPMVGTFYAAPKPGAAPFVEVGSVVEPQSALGIIETMKLMNSIAAGHAGTVAEILVSNGMMVQAGQTLMRLKP
jgi:acetyl-CoA carboxylase biotin carboxyl carrier protein